MAPRLISVDVGTKHFAACVFDTQTTMLVHLELTDLRCSGDAPKTRKKNRAPRAKVDKDVMEETLARLAGMAGDSHDAVSLVENQFATGWFQQKVRDVEKATKKKLAEVSVVKSVSANAKYATLGVDMSKNKAIRKATSTAYVTTWLASPLGQRHSTEAVRKTFRDKSKKDDMADTIMMVLAWLMKNNYQSVVCDKVTVQTIDLTDE